MRKAKPLTALEREYKRLRHNALERARYWRKKGVVIDLPAIPKKITEASVRNIKKRVETQAQKAKRKTPTKKRKRPTLEEIVLNRIYEIIDRGMGAGEWESYKSKLARDPIDEHLPDPGTEARKRVIREWITKLPQLDDILERFIFESSQNLRGEVWQTILRVITGASYFPDFGESDFEEY